MKQLNFVGDYLEDSLKKISGFDYNWTSMISSKPLLFEDLEYLKIKRYVNETITEEEVKAYKNGDLRDLYASLDNLLLCNLKYYDRIISYCTMIFFNYIKVDGERTSEHLSKVNHYIEMTPTKIWCASMANNNSTQWELEYGFDIKLRRSELNEYPIQKNYDLLLNNETFDKFISYRSLINNTNGFRTTWLVEKTDNKILSQACQKFIQLSNSIDEENISDIFDYCIDIDENNKKLYLALDKSLSVMYNDDKSQYAIYIYNNVFYIHTSKFSMKVYKDNNNKLSKDYLSNSYECFAAEQYLISSIKQQIEWSKYMLSDKHIKNKRVLTNILYKMIDYNYRNVVCVKRMKNIDNTESNTISRIKFSGVFQHLYIDEDLLFDNRVIKSYRICLSKEKAAQYIVDAGYYIFGTDESVTSFMEKITERGFRKEYITEYYSKHCSTILDNMQQHIDANILLKNEIIDFVCDNIDVKINNENIIETNIKAIKNTKKLISEISSNIKGKNNKAKNYWQAIEL